MMTNEQQIKATQKGTTHQHEVKEYIESIDNINDATHDVLKRPHVSFNSGNNEWYTPADYIDIARDVMGGIDLDPASSDIANIIVGAKEYYTAEINGLNMPWRGKVWMNPPYGSDLIGRFVDKLIEELPNVEQAMVLVNNATETKWFNKLISQASAVCFPHSRIKFYMPNGKTGAPLQGQALMYFGDNVSAFIEKGSTKGWCAIPSQPC